MQRQLGLGGLTLLAGEAGKLLLPAQHGGQGFGPKDRFWSIYCHHCVALCSSAHPLPQPELRNNCHDWSDLEALLGGYRDGGVQFLCCKLKNSTDG